LKIVVLNDHVAGRVSPPLLEVEPVGNHGQIVACAARLATAMGRSGTQLNPVTQWVPKWNGQMALGRLKTREIGKVDCAIGVQVRHCDAVHVSRRFRTLHASEKRREIAQVNEMVEICVAGTPKSRRNARKSKQ